MPSISSRLVATVATAALIGTAAAELPSGPGLAARFPRDAGIAKAPQVLLAEDFEAGELSELEKRWHDVSNKDGKVLMLSEDHPPDSAGRRSIQMTSTIGENTGGHLYKRLPREVETLFARFYVKFADDAQYVHHFVHMGGYRPATLHPQGGAGDRPKGDERFTVGIEPTGSRGKFPPPGQWNFYAYWPEMKASAGGRYWGAGIPAPKPAIIPREKWQCVEVMMKCNSTPEKSDGELALWTDGELAMHVAPGTPRGQWTGMGFDVLESGGEPFEGFRWRLHPELKINFFWLLFYVTENAGRQNKAADAKPTNRVWFDDIVLATEYIGPILKQ
jgi:hypothetical protein